jgi:hypothetical protein
MPAARSLLATARSRLLPLLLAYGLVHGALGQAVDTCKLEIVGAVGEYLHLGEVRLFGADGSQDPPESITMREQSSFIGSAEAVCPGCSTTDNLFDGYSYTFMHTDRAVGVRQSISADLPDMEGNRITCIELTDRQDCCHESLNGASVSLCGQPFGTVNDRINPPWTYDFPQFCVRNEAGLPRELELDLAVVCPYQASLTSDPTTW